MTDSTPVGVERFARVYTDGPEELPAQADTYRDPDGSYYFKLHLDDVTAEEATPLVRKAAEEFDVEIVERMHHGDIYKERVYIDDASEAPPDKKVHQGPNGGMYYETGVQRVGGGDGDERNVAVIHWEDVEEGDDIVYETPDGEETFAEIVSIEERGDRADVIHVTIDGESQRAMPGTYTVDKSDGVYAPIRLEKAWVPYKGPMGGEGWRNRKTGEIRYQERSPDEVDAEEDVEPGESEPDIDPSDPPDGGFADGWMAAPEDPTDLEAGTALEYHVGGQYGYGEVVEAAEDSITVESESGEARLLSPEDVTAVEEQQEAREPPDIEFEDVDPESFNDAVRTKIEEDPEMGAFLTEHDPEEFEGYDLILSAEGTAGAAVSEDGDIQNVFALDDAPGGAGRAVLQEAIESGGITLDCYDGYLRDLYQEFGFRETGRMEFNPEFAPEGFNPEKYGYPEVVFMHYDPESPSGDVAERYYEPADWGQAKEDSRGAADTGGDGGEAGRGVREGERGDDTGTGKARRGPLSKDDGVWTYYYGPEGGEGWLNVQTGEIRYQKQRPGEAPEGGDGYGDFTAEGWAEPPAEDGWEQNLMEGQMVELDYDQVGEVVDTDLGAVTVRFDHGGAETVEDTETSPDITAYEEDFDRHDPWFDNEDFTAEQYFDMEPAVPEHASESFQGIDVGDTEYAVELPTDEVVSVPFSGYIDGSDHPMVSTESLAVHYDDLEAAVGEEEMHDRWGEPGETSPLITLPDHAVDDMLLGPADQVDIPEDDAEETPEGPGDDWPGVDQDDLADISEGDTIGFFSGSGDYHEADAKLVEEEGILTEDDKWAFPETMEVFVEPSDEEPEESEGSDGPPTIDDGPFEGLVSVHSDDTVDQNVYESADQVGVEDIHDLEGGDRVIVTDGEHNYVAAETYNNGIGFDPTMGEGAHTIYPQDARVVGVHPEDVAEPGAEGEEDAADPDPPDEDEMADAVAQPASEDTETDKAYDPEPTAENQAVMTDRENDSEGEGDEPTTLVETDPEVDQPWEHETKAEGSDRTYVDCVEDAPDDKVVQAEVDDEGDVEGLYYE